jgi:hypothetical protein
MSWMVFFIQRRRQIGTFKRSRTVYVTFWCVSRLWSNPEKLWSVLQEVPKKIEYDFSVRCGCVFSTMFECSALNVEELMSGRI